MWLVVPTTLLGLTQGGLARVTGVVGAAGASATSSALAPPRMADGVGADASMGDTWFTAFEAREIADELGDDVREDELKRIFSIEPTEHLTSDDKSELMLMYKLRQELGEEDYKRIFMDPRVMGTDIYDK